MHFNLTGTWDKPKLGAPANKVAIVLNGTNVGYLSTEFRARILMLGKAGDYYPVNAGFSESDYRTARRKVIRTVKRLVNRNCKNLEEMQAATALRSVLKSNA